MEVGVLGPVQVRRDAVQVDLGSRKQRAVITALTLHAGQVVSVDKLVDLIWGDSPPPAVGPALQAYVANLRKALEPDRQRRAPATVLVTAGAGYALRVQSEQVDAGRFVRAVTTRHHRLTPVQHLVPTGRRHLPGAEDLVECLHDLDAALDLWRGEAYGELDAASDPDAERARLQELRLLALEDRAIAALALGRHGPVAAELEALTAVHPLRERLWGLRALALARSGRQAEALAVLGEVRTVLDDELGLEPCPELKALQLAVLQQDPAIDWQPPPGLERTPDSAPGVSAGPTTGTAARSDAFRFDAFRSDAFRSGAAALGGASEALDAAPPGPPLIGRTRHVQVLSELLDLAEGGTAQFVSLVGDPGIGKSRLATELVALARRRGTRVAVGRCSQDEGAPPLWPWTAVFGTLGEALPGVTGHEEPTQFAVWDAIARAVHGVAGEAPVVVVLDDLHWADTPTLRVLRLLAENPDPARLLVLATWRSHPEPTGALADLAESLARRHAVQLRLSGLSSAEVAEVVTGVAGGTLTGSDADALRARTDGNPFFLIEYARLAAGGDDLGRLLAEPDPPRAVHDVLVRRLDRLPGDTRSLLTLAAVIGREFDLVTLATVGRRDPDEVLDGLEPAATAGLLREERVDRFSFAHALVRDTAYTALTPSRRARAHAAAAQVLSADEGRETEVALHWAAAGPAFADRTWRAEVAAGAVARTLHAYDEAAAWLERALASIAGDRGAGDLDRYEVSMQLIDAYRRASQWPQLVETCANATALAQRIGDVRLVAQAASSTSIGALWQASPSGQVSEEVVGALQSCLAELPDDDPLRCRVLLALANEQSDVAPLAVRTALVDEASALAERLDADELRIDVDLITLNALRASVTAPRRLAAARRVTELARRLGEDYAFVVAATLRATVASELGDVAELREWLAIARAAAEEQHVAFGHVVLDYLDIGWLAMAGRFEEARDVLAHLEGVGRQVSEEHAADAVGTGRLLIWLWSGQADDVAANLADFDADTYPLVPWVASCLFRVGRDEPALAYLARGVVLVDDSWFAMANWATAAEVALRTGDADLARRSWELMRPYEGRCCQAGAGLSMGPVDGFLALAARGAGDRAAAGRYADRARQLTLAWDLPPVAAWLDGYRERYDF